MYIYTHKYMYIYIYIPHYSHCAVTDYSHLKRCRHAAGLCFGSRLRKGAVFAYVGLPQNLKDLKD